MCFLSYLVLLIKILLSYVAPLRSPLKTAYLRGAFSQCHQILTKLSFTAPPERHCRSVFNRTGASKCTSAFSCFILFCLLFVQFGVISVWWFYHFHSAIFVIYSFPTGLLSGATVVSFQGCISLAVFFIFQYLRHFCCN